jgi:hypothetical protein
MFRFHLQIDDSGPILDREAFSGKQKQLTRRLTPRMSVRHTCLTMKKVTIRNLRNEFPKVKEAVEADGEVVITDNGEPRYKLLYTPAVAQMAWPRTI